MEQPNSIIQTLSMISQPALCIKDNIIVYLNHAASALYLNIGDPVSTITENAVDFPEGTTRIQLHLLNSIREATIKKIDEYYVFILDSQPATEILKPLVNVAKSIRKPLSDISLLADISAQNRESGSRLDDHHTQIFRKSICQIERVLNNMSDLYRYCTDTTVGTELMDAVAFFDEIMENIRNMLSSSGLVIEYEGISGRLLTRINKLIISRAVYNLISNAVKYSPSGGVIKIKLSRSDNNLHLSIENTIDGNIKTFEDGSFPFASYLREPGIEESRIGCGFGMSVAHYAAMLHEGSLLYSKTENDGVCACFTIKINESSSLTLQSGAIQIDYDGFNESLIALSDCLPNDRF